MLYVWMLIKYSRALVYCSTNAMGKLKTVKFLQNNRRRTAKQTYNAVSFQIILYLGNVKITCVANF